MEAQQADLDVGGMFATKQDEEDHFVEKFEGEMVELSERINRASHTRKPVTALGKITEKGVIM